MSTTKNASTNNYEKLGKVIRTPPAIRPSYVSEHRRMKPVLDMARK